MWEVGERIRVFGKYVETINNEDGTCYLIFEQGGLRFKIKKPLNSYLYAPYGYYYFSGTIESIESKSGVVEIYLIRPYTLRYRRNLYGRNLYGQTK